MSDQVGLRAATPQDAEFVAPIIYDTMGFGTLMLGTDSKKECLRRIRKIFMIPGHRLSYDGCRILHLQDQALGYIMAYPHKEVIRRDIRFAWQLIRLNGLPGFIRLLFQHWNLLIKDESKPGEFYFSALGIARYRQKKGFALLMITKTLQTVWQQGYKKCSLVIDRENTPAKNLYQKLGFRIESSTYCDGHLLSRMTLQAPQ